MRRQVPLEIFTARRGAFVYPPEVIFGDLLQDIDESISIGQRSGVLVWYSRIHAKRFEDAPDEWRNWYLTLPPSSEKE